MYIFDLFLLFISHIILILGVLIGVPFLTLFERKILGYIQIRKGPNKVGFLGLIQPLSDAIKLFCKEYSDPTMSDFVSYHLSPVLNLFISLLLCFRLPFFSGFLHFSLGFLFLLCCSSFSVYTIMIARWPSNSNYSSLGGLRCVSQVISYEVNLAVILLSLLFLITGIGIFDLVVYQEYSYFFFISILLSMIWFTSGLAKTNRTPFNFTEGESELVSGFYVEYSGGGFALVLMAEYSSILFVSMLFIFLFFSGSLINLMFIYLVVLVSFVFISVRGTLSRYCYDKLMYLAGKSFFPVSLNFLMFFFGLKMAIFSLIF
nr:NADH dehydrogenase subunit 1 [Nipponoluciola cruciata]